MALARELTSFLRQEMRRATVVEVESMLSALVADGQA
jgi:hypothetical protein